jgi:hypothetical protein
MHTTGGFIIHEFRGFFLDKQLLPDVVQGKMSLDCKLKSEFITNEVPVSALSFEELKVVSKYKTAVQAETITH